MEALKGCQGSAKNLKYTAAVPSLNEVTNRRWHIWLQLALVLLYPRFSRLRSQCPFLEELSPRRGQKVKLPSWMCWCGPGKQEPKCASPVGEAAGRQLDGAVTSRACACRPRPSHAAAVLGERNHGASVGWAAMSRHRWQRTLVPLSQPVLDAGICVSPCLRDPLCEPSQPFLPLGALGRWIQLLPPMQELPQPSQFLPSGLHHFHRTSLCPGEL